MSGQWKRDPQVVTEGCPGGIEKLKVKRDKRDRDLRRITGKAGYTLDLGQVFCCYDMSCLSPAVRGR